MKQKDNFPGLAGLLQREFETWAAQNDGDYPRSARRWADAITAALPDWSLPSGRKSKTLISHSALHEWMQGWSRPQEKQVELLANFFYPGDKEQQEGFREKMRNATQSAETVLDPLDALAGAQPRKLKVGYVPFKHFCHGDGTGFLDGLILKLLSFSGLGSPQFINVKIDEAEHKLCKTGELDIVAGLFAEPQRSQKMMFFREIPLLIPINAVVLRPTTLDKRNELAEILTTPKTGTHRVIGVVDPKELGGIYARQYLQLPLKEVAYNIDQYATILKSLSNDTKEKRWPVAIIDEVSCMQCFRKLSESGVRDHNLVIGSDNDTSRDLVPHYRYSFAVARRHTRWAQLLSEALDYFIEANEQAVLNHFKELKSHLIEDWGAYEDELHVNKLIASWFQGKKVDQWSRIAADAKSYQPSGPTRP